jgi:low affinity Fe/Cu permease
MSDHCRAVAQWVSHHAGAPATILGAFAAVVLWLVSGPFVGFSESWQLFINTVTTIVTFLMVFLIQNAQNRDTKALHLKLDELIRGVQGARTRLVNLEQCSDEELDRLEAEFQRLRRQLAAGGGDSSAGGSARSRNPVHAAPAPDVTP